MDAPDADSSLNEARVMHLFVTRGLIAIAWAMVFMAVASKTFSDFVNKHPSIKLMALAFLLLIGISLIAEGVEQPIAKGYIYFAMGFSIFVELLIMKFMQRKKAAAARLKEKVSE